MSHQKTKRYALAYFQVAESKKVLSSISKDLEILDAMESKFRKIFLDINCAIFGKEMRLSFVASLFKAYKFHSITKNLLHLLANNGDLDLTGNIIKQWRILYLDLKKEAQLEVVSVNKVKIAELNSIKKFFEKKFGGKLQLKNTLDASILGGIMIKSGSFVLDNSVANKIKNMGLILKKEPERT